MKKNRFEAYSACHVAKTDMWYHMIGPRGIIGLVSCTHWSDDKHAYASQAE
jgi:hypothetical protein